MDPVLRRDFECVLFQMVSICPKLGINFKGSLEDINDAMIDTLKVYFLNFNLENQKVLNYLLSYEYLGSFCFKWISMLECYGS